MVTAVNDSQEDALGIRGVIIYVGVAKGGGGTCPAPTLISTPCCIASLPGRHLAGLPAGYLIADLLSTCYVKTLFLVLALLILGVDIQIAIYIEVVSFLLR